MGMFQTTRWSLLLRARGDEPQARAALEALCRTYRPPVLAYLARHGCTRDEAEDLTQAFFLKFLEHRYHATADPERGRFRTFLLTAVQRFVANVREHDRAAKRGGGVAAAPLDEGDLAAGDEETPEAAFDRAWARTLLGRALTRLRDEAAAAGKLALYQRLAPFLTEDPDPKDYERVAQDSGVRRNSIAVTVHRLRRRLKELVRMELADTVDSEKGLEAELQVLRGALGGD